MYTLWGEIAAMIAVMDADDPAVIQALIKLGYLKGRFSLELMKSVFADSEHRLLPLMHAYMYAQDFRESQGILRLSTFFSSLLIQKMSEKECLNSYRKGVESFQPFADISFQGNWNIIAQIYAMKKLGDFKTLHPIHMPEHLLPQGGANTLLRHWSGSIYAKELRHFGQSQEKNLIQSENLGTPFVSAEDQQKQRNIQEELERKPAWLKTMEAALMHYPGSRFTPLWIHFSKNITSPSLSESLKPGETKEKTLGAAEFMKQLRSPLLANRGLSSEPTSWEDFPY